MATEMHLLTGKTPKNFQHSLGFTLGIAAAAFSATLLPLLLFLRRFPRLAPVAVDAGDSFYYLTVARNSLHTSFYSFDGTYPTNGFHPVWQWLLYLGMRWNVLSPTDPTLTLYRLFIGNALILSVGYGLLTAFAARLLSRRWLAFFAVCPGFLWFAIAPTAPEYLSNWSYLNGMETSVELLCFGLALLIFPTSRGSTLRLLFSAFFFGLTVLSRLDDVFFLLPVFALLWLTRKERPMRQTIAAAAIPVAMIVAYLLYNHISVGVYMPTSGAVKAGFALRSNLRSLEQVILPIRWFAFSDMNWFPEIYLRVFQMVVPAIICSIYIARNGWSKLGIIQALCYGVLLKSLYNFIYVGLFHQGSWYFGASIFIANLIIAIWIDRAMESHPALKSDPVARSPWLMTAYSALFVSVTFNIYVNHLLGSGSQAVLNIIDHGNLLRAMVLREGSDRFIEMNDGELAYATGMPALSGQGLVLDPQAGQAIAQGHFFDLALKRKYSLLMASGLYETMIDQLIESDRHGGRQALFVISAKEFDNYRLIPVGFDSMTGVKLYRIVHK